MLRFGTLGLIAAVAVFGLIVSDSTTSRIIYGAVAFIAAVALVLAARERPKGTR